MRPLVAMILPLLAGCPGFAVEPDCTPTAPITVEERASQPLPSVEGFDSPYLGHTGSADGRGRAGGGGDKLPDLDAEAEMGLRWTFVPVHWSVMEKDGPTSHDDDPEGAWKSLDAFVKAARERRMHILMQAPIVGGNAGGPPKWAGVRRDGSAAPKDMDAVVAFAGKLAARYRPGGALSTEEGWTDGYGVRAWELENEPDAYLTNWKETADDYAEFITRVSARIREEDPSAVIIAAATTSGEGAQEFLEDALDKGRQKSSSTYARNNQQFSIGPSTGVVSFHVYEGMDKRTIECTLTDTRATWDRFSTQDGFTYAPRTHYWHTEGGYEFISIGPGMSTNRARWMVQWFARSFALGVGKVTVMDARDHPPQKRAATTMIRLLPNPFPMQEVSADASKARVFEGPNNVFIAWAANDLHGRTTVELPLRGTKAKRVNLDGDERPLEASGGAVRVELASSEPYSEPVFIVME